MKTLQSVLQQTWSIFWGATSMYIQCNKGKNKVVEELKVEIKVSNPKGFRFSQYEGILICYWPKLLYFHYSQKVNVG